MSGDPEVLAHSGIGSRAVAHEERCSWLSREYLCARSQKKLRTVRHREGGYLLRTNLCGQDPAELWQIYIQLVEIEATFKTMKNDLDLRPIYHELEDRIETHIFIAFLA